MSASRRTRALATWVPTIVFNAVLPAVTYSLLHDRGLATVPALAVSGLWPLIELGVGFARGARPDELSILVLIFLLLGIATALAFEDPRLVILKDSALTGLFGLVLLGSLLAPRPLMFYFGRRFATDGSSERLAWWNGLWRYSAFRRAQRILTVVWGGAFLAEAVARGVLALELPISTMVVVSPALFYAMLGALTLGTFAYGRRAGAAAAGFSSRAASA